MLHAARGTGPRQLNKKTNHHAKLRDEVNADNNSPAETRPEKNPHQPSTQSPEPRLKQSQHGRQLSTSAPGPGGCGVKPTVQLQLPLLGNNRHHIPIRHRQRTQAR